MSEEAQDDGKKQVGERPVPPPPIEIDVHDETRLLSKKRGVKPDDKKNGDG